MAATLRDLLIELTRRRGSDLVLKEGRPPIMRISGQMLPSEYLALTADALWALLGEVIGESYAKRLEAEREVDFGFEYEGIARFRANVFFQRSKIGAVIRAIPLEVPTIESLNLPSVLKDMAAAPNGILLVTGPTGSGKSTTLAAVVEYINRSRAAHIITIEDPIEFVYTDKKSTVTQRALGRDSLSIEKALRAALRQAPDVILAGEMRDRATMELAMHAAETGHLVLSTLHTNDAKQTIDRIIDTFPADARTGILRMLSVCLRGVLCQRLVRRTDGGGRVAAIEIMVNSPAIAVMLEKGNVHDIQKAIESSSSYYRMQSFNQALADLIRKRMISEEDGMANTATPSDLKLMLKGVTKSAGIDPNAPGVAPLEAAPPPPEAAPPPAAAATPRRDAAEAPLALVCEPFPPLGLIDGMPILAGRVAGNHIILPHAEVSRHHAQFERRGDFVVVTDLGSANGIVFEHERVREARLVAGEAVEIGPYRIECRRVDAQPPAAIDDATRLGEASGGLSADAGLADVLRACSMGELTGTIEVESAGRLSGRIALRTGTAWRASCGATTGAAAIVELLRLGPGAQPRLVPGDVAGPREITEDLDELLQREAPMT